MNSNLGFDETSDSESRLSAQPSVHCIDSQRAYQVSGRPGGFPHASGRWESKIGKRYSVRKKICEQN